MQVRQLRHRLLQFRHDNSGVVVVTATPRRHDNSDSTSTQDRKAFVTTVILLATLTFFFLPHTVYFFVSLNTDVSPPEHLSAAASFVLVLYMTLLPYLKMISDPLVYGVRMCRRPSAGHAVNSRVVYADAASAPAALRGAATSTSPVTRLSAVFTFSSPSTHALLQHGLTASLSLRHW